MAEAAPAAIDAGRVLASQLSLANDQLKRSPYVVAAIELFVAWLLVRAGVTPWMFAWAVLSIALQWGRSHHVGVIVGRPSSPTAADLRQVEWWFLALGAVRAWPVAVGFMTDNIDVHYILTLVAIGAAAGGLGSAAGMVRAYALWAIPLASTLVGGWLIQNTFEGYWVAALLVMMFWLMILTVRNYGQTLQQLGREVERVNAERLRAEAERQRAEIERHRADDERERAEVAVEAKTRFFAAASHDLRQPLGVLRWYGDAVRLHADRLGHEPLQAIGEGIGRALEHAEPLVGRYLDIARIEAGALQLSPRPLALSPLFEQVREGLAHAAQASDLQLVIDLHGHPDALHVHTDADVLRSILDNLVGNALKFTPAGGTVTLAARRLDTPAGPVVRLSVRDNGIGIAAADQARVFDDFFQVDNRERNRSKGMGLGLAIVRRQALLIGSAIHLNSAPGEGATFELDLAAAAPGCTPVPAPAAPGWAAASQGALRVLVIDDEPEIRHALRLMLEAVHWQVHTAAGLADALAALNTGLVPDAVLVDYRLRDDENGVEVVRQLRSAGCQAPAVVLTGDTSPAQLRHLADTGLPVLHKPVAGERLVATVIDLIAKAGNTP